MGKHRLPVQRSFGRCDVPGCDQPRVQRSSSRYCHTHRYHWRVHGSPLQDRLRIAEVRRYEVDARRVFAHLPKRNRADLEGTAARYCATFREVLTQQQAGQNKYGREAASRLLRVFENEKPLPILTRLSALYLMRQHQPHAFRDDRAFRWQLVRCFRKLTSVADGIYWNSRDQRKQQIVKTIHVRVQELMAEWLVEFSVPFVSEVRACSTLLDKVERTNAFLAADVFKPLRDKLNAEHSRLERKLSLARRLHAEQSATAST